jgi:putative heme-binding domain-containing protein
VVLRDEDGDGVADRREEVGEMLSGEDEGPAGGLVLEEGGGGWLACRPSLWRVGADGVRTSVVSGLGLRAGVGGPGVFAPVVLADGRVGFLTGGRGARPVHGEGRPLEVDFGGALVTCRADGSGLERMVRVADPLAVVPDDVGRLWLAAGGEGKTSRLLSVLPGSVVPEEVATLPYRVAAMVLDPVETEDGKMVRMLVGAGPGEGAGLHRVTLVRGENSWTLREDEVLWNGGAVAAVAAGLDGSLYWADWGADFGEAAVCRICWRKGEGKVREVVAGGDDRWDAVAVAKGLRSAVAAERRWAAGRCRKEKSAGMVAVVMGVAADGGGGGGVRREAVRLAAEVAGRDPLRVPEFLMLAKDPEGYVREMVALKLPGIDPDLAAGVALRLAADEDAAVAAAGMVAAAQIVPEATAELLERVLAGSLPNHGGYRAAVAGALARCGDPVVLGGRIRSETPREVRRVIAEALISGRHAAAADVLLDPDPELAVWGAKRLYDEEVVSTWVGLAAMADRCGTAPVFSGVRVLESVLAAAERTGSEAAAGAVGRLFRLPEGILPEGMAAKALEVLAGWDGKVGAGADGELGRLPRRARNAWPVLREVTARLVAGGGPLAGRAREVAKTVALAGPERLAALVKDGDAAEEARVGAMQDLSVTAPGLALSTALELTAGAAPAVVLAEARRVILKYQPGSLPVQLEMVMNSGTIPEKQVLLRALDRYNGADSERLWAGVVRMWLEGLPDPACHVEILEGVVRRDNGPRSRWRRWLEPWEASLRSDIDPLARWRMCQAGGDAEVGRLVFESHPLARCMDCHQLEGRGGSKGPVLDGVAARLSSGQLLGALVTPSEKCGEEYGEQSVVLRDGSERSGRVTGRGEDGRLEMETRGGVLRIPAGAVMEEGERLSPMPAMGTVLTPRELRDLMAWLNTLK